MSLTSRGARLLGGWVLLALTFALTFHARPAHAAGTPATSFFEGSMSGDDIINWTLWLGRSGSKMYGLTYGNGGPAPDDDLIGARMEGTATRKKVNLKIYPIVARNTRVPIGKLTGTISGNTITGTFSMAGRRGTFTTTFETADTTEMQEQAGIHEGETAAGDLTLNLSRKGTFTLTGRAFGEELFRATGGWLITPEGQLWVLPTAFKGTNSFFDFTFKFKAPFALNIGSDAGGFTLTEPVRNTVIAHFRKR